VRRVIREFRFAQAQARGRSEGEYRRIRRGPRIGRHHIG